MESKFYEITEVDDVIDFVTQRERNHTYYCHYSSLRNIDKVLENECIWLSHIDSFNDLNEGDAAGNDNNLFGLCFSALYSENLPMWYLYGGVTGQGARITFKKAAFKDWLDNLEFILVNKLDSREIQKIKPQYVKTHDVIYASLEGNDNVCRIKYNGGVNKNFNSEDYAILKEKHRGFIKQLPWFYEKEFRILIRVDDDTAQRLNIKKSNVKLAVRLKQECFKTFDVMLGPESVINDFSAYKGFTKFLNTKISKSSFNKVKMDLLKRNKASIVEEIEQWCDAENATQVCNYLSKINSCNNTASDSAEVKNNENI